MFEGDNNYFRPADSVKAGGYFFYAGKTLNGAFRGVLEELETFLAPENGPERSEGPFWGQK